MAQWKEDRRCRALHEASHAVVARKLGLAVLHVTIRKRRAHALHTSAAYLAGLDDAKGRIEALEKDAIVAQAGYTADVYEYRHPVGAPDFLMWRMRTQIRAVRGEPSIRSFAFKPAALLTRGADSRSR